MADETVVTKYLLDEKDYIDGLNKMQKETKETSNTTISENKKVSKSWGDVGLKAKIGIGIAVTALIGIVSKLKEAADGAAEYERNMRGLEEVSRAFGQDGGAAKQFAQEIEEMTSGMVSASQAAEGLKFLISSGYSLDQASEMSKAMLNIGAFNNVVGDLGQAFVDSSKGMKTGSIELIENIGLTEKLSSVMKRAGVDATNGIDITNNAEQAQALYNSVLKQGEIFTGNLDKATQGYLGTQAEAGIVLNKLWRIIGEKFQPVLQKAYEITTKLLKPLVEDQPKKSEQLQSLITEMNNLQSQTDLTAIEQERLQTVMNEISLLAPQAVTDYDNQGNAVVNYTTALQGLLSVKKLELLAEKEKLELDNKADEKKIKANEEEIKAARKALDWQQTKRKEAMKYTAMTPKMIQDVADQQAAEEAAFNEKFRFQIAENKALEDSIKLREEQTKSIEKTIKEMEDTTTIEKYTTEVKKLNDALAGEGTGKAVATPEVKKAKYTPISNVNDTFREEYNKFNAEQTKLTQQAAEDQNAIEKRSVDEKIALMNKEIENKKRYAEEKIALDEALIESSKANTDKELAQDAYYMSVKNQIDAKEAAAISARMGLKKAESELTSKLVEGEKISLGELGGIIAKQVEMTLTGIAVESGIQSLFNLAKGLAFTAIGKVDSAAAAFSASATFATTAAAAGLGATAASTIGGNITPVEQTDNTEVPTGEDTDNLVDTTKDEIINKETIYISKADWQRTAYQQVDSINEAILSGKKLAKGW